MSDSCDPVVWSLPGSSVHGILQARILEWVGDLMKNASGLLLPRIPAPQLHLPSSIVTEKEMATHSSILAWRILWAEEPDGLLSMGSQSQSWLKQLSSSSSSSSIVNAPKKHSSSVLFPLQHSEALPAYLSRSPGHPNHLCTCDLVLQLDCKILKLI